MKLIEVEVGSRMWGLQREDSDHDIREVRAASFSELVNPWRGDGDHPMMDHTVIETDRSVYEVIRFCKLAASGNSTMMEVLYATDNIIYKSRYWDALKPEWFLDDIRIAKAHMGFARSQREQVETLWRDKGANAKRIGKAFSSGILTLMSGIELIIHGEISRYLTDDQRQFHMDLRMGHRLIEGTEELEVMSKAMEQTYINLPDDHSEVNRRAITEWLGDIYAGIAITERPPENLRWFMWGGSQHGLL